MFSSFDLISLGTPALRGTIAFSSGFAELRRAAPTEVEGRSELGQQSHKVEHHHQEINDGHGRGV